MGAPTWWCNEVVDELEGCVPTVIAPTAATLVYRPKVLSFVLVVVRELAIPSGQFLFVARVPDISGFWVTCHDFRSQKWLQQLHPAHVHQVA